MNEKCLECDEPAIWVRCTQFAGNHPYCSYHAFLESDFNDEPDSYQFWRKISSDQDTQQSTEVQS